MRCHPEALIPRVRAVLLFCLLFPWVSQVGCSIALAFTPGKLPTNRRLERLAISVHFINNNNMFRRITGLLAVCLVFSCLAPVTHAETLQSPNYRFDESSIGAGGLVQSSSANYQSNSAIGDLGVGNAASANYQIQAGSKTTDDPRLAVELISTNANFGNFSAAVAATATASFSVLNYTAYGYVVQLEGAPPTNGTHTIPGLSANTASAAGIEQFGVNLVANTSPASIGANPNNGQFGFGQVNANYATSNQYRYVSGETIASAPKSSGVTTYTLSYLVNVNTLTPGGQYASNQRIIVTGTY